MRSGGEDLIKNTNDNIRYVSYRMFLENGYEATNIRDICKEVGIKPSSLYFYYESKEDLFFSIYDEVWSERIKCIEEIEELGKDISPDIKLYSVFERIVEFTTKDITKQKFLLRYLLFPSVDILPIIREKRKYWVAKEEEIILDIIKQCINKGLLSNRKKSTDYSQAYKKFENYHVLEMIVTNIKMSSAEIDLSWVKFWNGIMLAN